VVVVGVGGGVAELGMPKIKHHSPLADPPEIGISKISEDAN
jgi:hypothetical protein